MRLSGVMINAENGAPRIWSGGSPSSRDKRDVVVVDEPCVRRPLEDERETRGPRLPPARVGKTALRYVTAPCSPIGRNPTIPQSTVNVGHWQARDAAHMDEILRSLRLAELLTAETVPSTRHPSDPTRAASGPESESVPTAG